jgi:hypothetical protein
MPAQYRAHTCRAPRTTGTGRRPLCTPPCPIMPLRRRITTTMRWPNHSLLARTHDPRPAQAILVSCRTRVRLPRPERALGRTSRRMIRCTQRHIRTLGCSKILCIAFEAVQQKSRLCGTLGHVGWCVSSVHGDRRLRRGVFRHRVNCKFFQWFFLHCY